MVESKYVVLQMIPHTLFIEWDFWTLFTSRLLFMTMFTRRFTVFGHCSLAVLLFMVLFPSRFTVH